MQCILMFAYLFVFLITSSEVFVPFVTTPKTDCVIFSITIMSYKQSAVQKTAQRDCPR